MFELDCLYIIIVIDIFRILLLVFGKKHNVISSCSDRLMNL
jgi:hypothetical protein